MNNLVPDDTHHTFVFHITSGFDNEIIWVLLAVFLGVIQCSARI
jgi:hypothetical protein